MPEAAFDPSESPPDIGDLVNQVAGGQPAAQPQSQPPPQPPPPPPQPPAPPSQQPPAAPDPNQPYAFGEEPWRQQLPTGQQPVQPGVQPQESPDFLSYVAGKGLDLSQFGGESADPQKVVDYLMEQSAAANQYRRQLQFLSQQNQEPQPPPAAPEPTAEPPKPTGAEPPVLTDADRWVMKGLQNGTVKESDLLPQQRANIEAWMDWRSKRADLLVDKPMEVLRADLEQLLSEQGYVRKDQMEAMVREVRDNDVREKVNREHERDFYVVDDKDQFVIDPDTGERRVSEWGWNFINNREYYTKTCGIKDPALLYQTIIRTIGLPPRKKNGSQSPQLSAQPSASPQPVPQPAATPQQTFVDAATQAATQFPPYPTADRGGVQGQPYLGTSPDDMTPPDINAVAQELLGPQAHGWR
jgi:hypothetical protein